MFNHLPPDVRQYLLITANYWAFTLTDGALRMLVVLYFHQLGYAPLEIALLFIFYESFGVITNIVGGWLGAKLGLNRTMNVGLGLQIVALAMLAIPQTSLSLFWVMAAQALSGIAKDLNKMSAKSAIKLLLPEQASGTLYQWVSRLTGSKNTLKGVGFFLGGALLTLFGFQHAVISMAIALTLVWLLSLLLLRQDLGKASIKPKFNELFSKSSAINRLSLARFFLFGARDVWFVIALPIFLSQQLAWGHGSIGAFMAIWVIAYGIVQTQTPKLTRQYGVPDGRLATQWAAALSLLPACIAIVLIIATDQTQLTTLTLILGLMLFGFVFAVNSSIHSFLIVHYADKSSISMDVGFYYMANAAGRLMGTVLSGWLFQHFGLAICLFASSLFLLLSTIASAQLPKEPTSSISS